MQKETELESITGVITAIASVQKHLDDLQNTCCMPTRSQRMSRLQKQLDGLKKAMDADNLHTNFDDVVGKLVTLGGQIGEMHVSCCTEIREPHYQRMLGQLNRAHNELHRLMGVGH